MSQSSVLRKILQFRIVENHLCPDDLAGAVRIHRTELHGGFLSSLGDGALRLMFEFAADSPEAVLLVGREVSRDEVAGFLLGTYSTGSFYKDFLMRRFFRALWVLGPRLLTPRRLFKAIETLFYPLRRQKKRLPNAELLDLAVASRFQGSGLGRLLFARFCSILRARDVSELRITTGESLTSAHVFYERLGALRSHDIQVHKGQSTRVYTYPLSAPKEASRSVL